MITFDEPTIGIESEQQDNKFSACGKLLLSAISDWPAFNLSEPVDLIADLQKEINKPLTFENLNLYLRGLDIYVIGNSWKMEALAALIQIFTYYTGDSFNNGVTLESIIEGLTQYYQTWSTSPI